ncbi:MAG: hypothetical protein FJ298_01905 [Planctomycetes bacterium]|nr:hypothetical protein [Planctomycetota bacterium]
MKLALVTVPWDAQGEHAQGVRSLVLELRERAEISVFVERSRAGLDWLGAPTRSASALVPRDFDQVLYCVDDALEHAFMAPLVRNLGGCVALHDWRLRTFAHALAPAIARGGWRGLRAGFEEGGFEGAREGWAGARDGASPLNRSIVRFGDAFLVRDEALRDAILTDRNAPTPIAVVPWPTHVDGDWSAVAQALLRAFERFPAPRAARKGLVSFQIRERLRERTERPPP